MKSIITGAITAVKLKIFEIFSGVESELLVADRILTEILQCCTPVSEARALHYSVGQTVCAMQMDNGGLDNTLNVSQSGRCNSGYLGSLGSGLGLSGIEVYQHNAKTRLGGCNLLNGFGLIGNG